MQQPHSVAQQQALRAPQTLGVRCPDFEPGRQIPREYTCQGDDVSPELQITGVPSSAQALALICDDPDAPGGTFTHWTVWNLPPDTRVIPRNADVLALGGIQGQNDFGRTGYGGPCPPRGSGAHRYVFRVFALDQRVAAPENAPPAEVWRSLAPHVLAWGELMGTYQKA